MTQLTNIRGVVHGRTIELEEELTVPDGETVTVTIAYDKLASGKLRRRPA